MQWTPLDQQTVQELVFANESTLSYTQAFLKPHPSHFQLQKNQPPFSFLTAVPASNHTCFFLSSSVLLLSSFASFLFLFPFFSSLLLLSLPFLPPLLFLSSFLFSLFLSLLFYRPLLVLSSPLPYSPSSSSSPSSAPSSFLIPSPSPLPLPFHLSISSLPLPTTSSFTLLLPHSFLASSDPFLLNASHLFLPVRNPPPGLSHLWLQQGVGGGEQDGPSPRRTRRKCPCSAS